MTAPTVSSKKSGGGKKIGRSQRKGKDSVLSLFVRGKITAEKYFKLKGFTTHQSYSRKAFNLK